MKECHNCKRQQDDQAVICSYCGALLITVDATSTRTLGDTDFEENDPRWGTARFSQRMNLVITIRDNNATFVYDSGQIKELVIGRYDSDSGSMPDIDLREFNAAEKGVSRRHASIVRRDGALSIIDHNSGNGTFLNGQRLVPNQPRILRDGDDVRLGYLVLHIRFVRAAN